MKALRYLGTVPCLCCFLSTFLCLAPATGLMAQSDEKKAELQRQEEIDDYFERWLKQDVVYIITDEEKSVFSSLNTPEEKEQFIEQFWHRRDPDLGTAINEFKEEHYRRITYANEKFPSALPGWKTDRGRVYILHGKPQEIEAHPAGGTYRRPLHEGGGWTGTYPFEIWRYRHLEGIGFDIELEFVDPSFSEEYRLAMRPEEKDAFLNVQGGWTLAEEMGLRDKSERPYFRPGNFQAFEEYPHQYIREKDYPFRRYETYTFVQSPPDIKYKDLKEMVDVNISYSTLPFQIRADYFRLNEKQVIVPVSIEIENKDLTFHNETGMYEAKIGVYGVITDLGNHLIMEFEDDVKAQFPPEKFSTGRTLRSMYQKTLPLDIKNRYKLDVVVKDLKSLKVGVLRQALVPPRFAEDKLTATPLMLSDNIRKLDLVPEKDEMFVLGDLWIVPILRRSFYRENPFGVYTQVYGAGLDQATLEPSLKVTYQINQDGKTVVELVDEGGESIHFFSAQRVVLARGLPIKDLPTGTYQLVVKIEDLLTDQNVSLTDRFELTSATMTAQAQ